MKAFLLILMTFFTPVCFSEITPIDSFRELNESVRELSSKDLVLFDVDMVLVQPSEPAFQMSNMKKYGPIAKEVMKSLPEEKQMVFLALITISSDPILIEDQIVDLLGFLQAKCIPCIALTANLTGSLAEVSCMEMKRIESLKKLGIDFSKTAPSQSDIIFKNLASYRNNYSRFLDGVFFVNGTTVSKGEALLAFLDRIDFYPEKIIFIDDKEDNLKNVEFALKQLDKKILYQGFLYNGAKKYPSKDLSEKDFYEKWCELAEKTRHQAI
jgi:hypothetical protein